MDLATPWIVVFAIATMFATFLYLHRFEVERHQTTLWTTNLQMRSGVSMLQTLQVASHVPMRPLHAGAVPLNAPIVDSDHAPPVPRAHQAGAVLPSILAALLTAGFIAFRRSLTVKSEQISLSFLTSERSNRGPRPYDLRRHAVPIANKEEEASFTDEEVEEPWEVAEGEESVEDDEDEDEEWDPSEVPEGYRVVDIADDEIITLEQLDEWERTHGPKEPWPESFTPFYAEDDKSAIPLDEDEGDGQEPLPFLETQPKRYTEEGFAVVTDADDYGTEVVYTMEASPRQALQGSGFAFGEDEEIYDDPDNGWEVSGWTTGRQRGIRRSMQEQNWNVALKRPNLQAIAARPPKQKRAKLPVVAVVGRPNVGKSTLVNRICDLASTEGAIVNDEVGVTRDRTYRPAQFENYRFMVVDTGGIIFEDDEEFIFAKQIRQQALVALSECKAAIVVVDGKDGPNAVDEDVARLIQKDYLSRGIAVYLAVNKCEGDSLDIDLNIASFWALGIGEPRAVSSIHGIGVYELLQAICTENFNPTDAAYDDSTINVALVGRPNVGKSSLLNRLVGQERAIVSPMAGTTRDTIDCELERGENVFRLVDTAGLRQSSKVEEGNETFMVNRTMKAIARADVCLLLLDATTDGFVATQDKDIADRIVESGAACCVLLNKWDAYSAKDSKSYLEVAEELESKLPDIHWAPQLLVSASTGLRCKKIFDAVLEADKARRYVFDVLELNDALFEAMKVKPPVSPSSKKGGRVYYALQEGTKPPHIVVYVNTKSAFTDNYRSYLERALRKRFPLAGSPLQLVLQSTRQRDAVKRCPPEIAKVIWDAVDSGMQHQYTALCT